MGSPMMAMTNVTRMTRMESMQRKEPEKPKERARILVVDDENGPRQSLRMLLKEEHEVLLASDVPSAIEVLNQTPINLVITDIRMPKQSGVELLQYVKEHHPETQVIILTGYAHLDTAMQAVEFGAFAYLEKPFDNEAMLRHVQAGIEKYEQEHELHVLEKLAIEANRFETLGRLVSGMIHDMGTPLTVVGSQVEMILNNPNRGDISERLQMVYSQVRHCSDMVRSAMNVLRYDGQQQAAFLLNDALETCLEVARPLLHGQCVQLTRDLMCDLPSCVGDIVLVRQAVLNLITNACHAMNEPGRKQELILRTWFEDNYVCFSIQDSGPGVPVENRERMFDTFFTTKGDKGTGLGLAVVRNVMRRHKGSVTLAETPEGEGACFVLRFPAATREDIVLTFQKAHGGDNGPA